MSDERPGLDHAIIHRDWHVSRVRVVLNSEIDEAKAELGMLFPRETIYQSPMGCCHTCLYTDTAPASLVAERIAEHLSSFEHR
jgi:hypothetical protein